MRDSLKEQSADVNGVWQDLRGVKALGVDARSGVQVIARAARILRSLEGESQGLSLSEIAERVGLARSTVHRIVTALEAERFVVYAANRVRVRLGPGLASLAASARRELRVELHPYLQKLSSQVQETVDLAVLDGDRVYFIDQIPAPHRLSAVSSVGASFPIHCTANGKALLATLPDVQVLQTLPRRLERLTPNTITRRDDLLAQLAEVRQTGIAFDREEHTTGIAAIGSVVGDGLGTLAAVTIPMPAQRFYGNEERLAGILRSACEEMTRIIGTQAR